MINCIFYGFIKAHYMLKKSVTAISEYAIDDPKHFNLPLLGTLTTNQLVWFDETHRTCLLSKTYLVEEEDDQ